MGSHCGTLFLTVAFFFTIFFSSSTLHFASATRPLHGGHRFKNQALHLESLQSGPVPPSDSSACSHIPGSGVCINGMNYAGTVVRPLPPATRPLHGGHRFKNQALHLESLQSGPVPPSDSSACSHIPGSGVCINGMNYAGTVVRPLPPATILDSVASETKKKDPSS